MDHPNRPARPGRADRSIRRRRTARTPRAHALGCARELRVRMLVRAGDPAEPGAVLLRQIAHEIHRHCGQNLIKAHRLAWGLTVEKAVAAVHRMCAEQGLGARGLSERSWKHWETGERPNADYQDLLARLFHTSPIGLGFGADYTDDDTNDNTAAERSAPAGRDPAPVPSPSRSPRAGDPARVFDSIEGQLTMAADESARLADQPSNLGPVTLDQLRTDARTLARRFANAPRLELFHQSRLLRDRVFTLLDARQRLSETRDLYFLAATSLGMLAEVSHDLGFPTQAITHTRTGLLCAREAGHPDLAAWMLGTQSLVAFWDGRPVHALDCARRGQDMSAKGTVSVALFAHAARAAAATGDSATAREALNRAGAAREQVRDDVLDTSLGGIFSFSRPKEQHYAGAAWLAIGDGARARQSAQAAITGYQQGPAEERARDNESIGQINIALAHVLEDDLDAASERLTAALTLPTDVRIANFYVSLRRLGEQVSVPRFQNAVPAGAMRERIEHALATR